MAAVAAASASRRMHIHWGVSYCQRFAGGCLGIGESGVVNRDSEGFERIDVHLCRRHGGLWWSIRKATWMQSVRCVERLLPDCMHRHHPFEEYFRWREER